MNEQKRKKTCLEPSSVYSFIREAFNYNNHRCNVDVDDDDESTSGGG